MTDISRRCFTCVHWAPSMPVAGSSAWKPAYCKSGDSPQYGQPTEGDDVCDNWQTTEMAICLPIYAHCPRSLRGIHNTISVGDYHVCSECGARSLKKRWWICYDATKMECWAIYSEHLTPADTRYAGPFEKYEAEGQLLKKRGHRRGQ